MRRTPAQTNTYLCEHCQWMNAKTFKSNHDCPSTKFNYIHTSYTYIKSDAIDRCVIDVEGGSEGDGLSKK